MQAHEDEVKGSHMLLSGELMMRLHDGMRKDLDLMHRSTDRASDVLLKDPSNVFAREQHERFQLMFENQVKELKNLTRTSTKKFAGKKRSIIVLDLTADSDSKSNDDSPQTPTTVSPK